MVYVNEGEALLGRDRKPIRVPAFYIDRTEVTNQAYQEFCAASGRNPPAGGRSASPATPVVGVSFDDAQAFAKWAKKRLPTAVEWEKAARGLKGRTYPWGEGFSFDLANLPRDPSEKRQAVAAASYGGGASPYGAVHMIGNVWEWVNTTARPPQGEHFQSLTEKFDPPLRSSEPFYQIRGGSFEQFFSSEELATLSFDWVAMPERAQRSDIGFRCARNP